jgi:arylsulfatase A
MHPRQAGGIPVLYKQVKASSSRNSTISTPTSVNPRISPPRNPDEVARLQKHAEAVRVELGDSLMKMPKGTGTREAGK